MSEEYPVLEHVLNPLLLLQVTFRVLKREGILMVDVFSQNGSMSVTLRYRIAIALSKKHFFGQPVWQETK